MTCTSPAEVRGVYGVTYRNTDGKVRHVRVLAATAAEAAGHAQRTVVGFDRLERVSLATRDPFQRPDVNGQQGEGER